MYAVVARIRDTCCIPWCTRKSTNNPFAPFGYGFHEDHQTDLYELFGVKVNNPSAMTMDIPGMVDEIFDKCFHCCAHHHDQKVSAEYVRPASALQNELIYEATGQHVGGFELVTSFEVFVFVIKMFALGAWNSFHDQTNDLPFRSDVWFWHVFEDFGLSFNDVVEWNPSRWDSLSGQSRMRDSLSGQGQFDTYRLRRKFAGNIIMGILRKLSQNCANIACPNNEDFMKESPRTHSGNHWDHEGGKEVQPAHLARLSLPKILNEVGRYLALTCSPCHGVKTWVNVNKITGRKFQDDIEVITLLARITNV